MLCSTEPDCSLSKYSKFSGVENCLVCLLSHGAAAAIIGGLGRMIMKLSKLAHLMSIVTGIAGAFCLIGAWAAGERGAFLGFSQAHLFNDAIVLELITIAMAVCTLVRMQMERDHPGSSPVI